ncbi:hypothetical protein CAPTEDRAFT_197994 [Capitella teleta]|uniref:Uncharacterized protein n=1 Tax=Capitella teleta TaxID=283909 RepID=R7TD17_CAPTE|nr:hypothetical protein CAPTEDRAFT_197994 [Capitella teleta]|eukprot:ELT89377.1 hypothetical protein CAPTEDRAFT_197994 [Capitella teleta]
MDVDTPIKIMEAPKDNGMSTYKAAGDIAMSYVPGRRVWIYPKCGIRLLSNSRTCQSSVEIGAIMDSATSSISVDDLQSAVGKTFTSYKELENFINELETAINLVISVVDSGTIERSKCEIIM